MAAVRPLSAGAWPTGASLPNKVLQGALTALCVLVCGAGVYTLQPALNRPVATIDVRGHLQRLSPQQVAAAAQLAPGARFFDVDVSAVRARVDRLPWVANASVTRRWPGRLEISITERQPIARWGKTGLLDARGQPFQPRAARLSPSQRQALPQLNGSTQQADDVLAAWNALAPALAGTPLALAGLAENPRGSFKAVTRSRIILHLGTPNPAARLKTIQTAVLPALRGKFATVAAIDLRYTNGFAVAQKSGTPTKKRKT